MGTTEFELIAANVWGGMTGTQTTCALLAWAGKLNGEERLFSHGKISDASTISSHIQACARPERTGPDGVFKCGGTSGRGWATRSWYENFGFRPKRQPEDELIIALPHDPTMRQVKRPVLLNGRCDPNGPQDKCTADLTKTYEMQGAQTLGREQTPTTPAVYGEQWQEDACAKLARENGADPIVGAPRVIGVRALTAD